MVETVKLHLGCGPKYLPGFIHVDALAFPHVDRIGPVDVLDGFEDNSVDMIYAAHVLEHFGRREVDRVLKEWYRVIKPGGILRLAVPNFGAAAKLYMTPGTPFNLNHFLGLMVGGQKDEYDYHGMVFDEALLTEKLKGAGFKEVRWWDWRKTEHVFLDDYSQAYLPHMDKENGTLVSLNLEAVK